MSNINHTKGRSGAWKVHTVGLLKEIQNNPGTGAMRIPLQIFADILEEVAARAIVLDDKEMNKLMIRLTLYEEADPNSKEYAGSRKIEKYLRS